MSQKRVIRKAPREGGGAQGCEATEAGGTALWRLMARSGWEVAPWAGSSLGRTRDGVGRGPRPAQQPPALGLSSGSVHPPLSAPRPQPALPQGLVGTGTPPARDQASSVSFQVPEPRTSGGCVFSPSSLSLPC